MRLRVSSGGLTAWGVPCSCMMRLALTTSGEELTRSLNLSQTRQPSPVCASFGCQLLLLGLLLHQVVPRRAYNEELSNVLYVALPLLRSVADLGSRQGAARIDLPYCLQCP
jgi:hypothetical protein